MTISVCISTFGDPAKWLPLADRAAASVPPDVELVRVHLDGTDPGLCGAARNAGIARATGSYVVVLDADDELAPGYVAAMLPRLAPDAVLMPAVSARGRDGWSVPRVLDSQRSTAARMRQIVIGACFPRAQWEREPFREDLPWGEDCAFWLGCERAGLRFVSMPDAVYRMDRRPDGRRHFRGRGAMWAEIYRERVGRKAA